VSARIIDGKSVAAALRVDVATAVRDLAGHGVVPGLAVVLVGDDPASAIYVRNKAKATVEAGMAGFEHRLPASTGQAALLDLVGRLNADPAVDGILVQLPLPAHIDQAAVVAAIDPAKDVDGLTVENAGRLMQGQPGLVPCTPLGCLILLRRTLGDLAGRRALVIGRSILVGKPAAQLLLAENCTVAMAHSRTRDLPEEARRAEILIAAIGRPEFVRGDWIQPGATIIDVGINRIAAPPVDSQVDSRAEGAAGGKVRIVGDVAFAEAAAVAGAITPVPGGVGPMTIACLLANTVTAACRRHGLPAPDWREAG
jgi:methylenetetrahydrofolate dehydrogenase (NADP+)/methenyltetrahydrofolate cyclohydrolase